MNKVILMGRLTKDPDVRYSQGNQPLCITRYSLAVNRRIHKDNEPDADFFNCVAFGKSGEFAEKYFRKGQLVSVVGRLQNGSYEKDGIKRYTTDVIIEDQYFAESKSSSEGKRSEYEQSSSSNSQNSQKSPKPADENFFAIDDTLDDEDLPF